MCLAVGGGVRGEGGVVLGFCLICWRMDELLLKLNFEGDAKVSRYLEQLGMWW